MSSTTPAYLKKMSIFRVCGPFFYYLFWAILGYFDQYLPFLALLFIWAHLRSGHVHRKKTDFWHSHNKKKMSFVNNLILPIYRNASIKRPLD